MRERGLSDVKMTGGKKLISVWEKEHVKHKYMPTINFVFPVVSDGNSSRPLSIVLFFFALVLSFVVVPLPKENKQGLSLPPSRLHSHGTNGVDVVGDTRAGAGDRHARKRDSPE